jgi:iron complex transport system permease protein
MGTTERLKLHSFITILSLLALLMLLTAIISLLIGPVNISIKKLLQIITGQIQNTTASEIILSIRLPRILLAIAAGGGLSVAGAVFQSLLMNPLAEPYILGISSGGTFGALLSMLLGLSFLTTQLFSFAGAVVVIFLVFTLGKKFGELQPNVLLLSGVMIGAFFSAAILIMMTMLNNSLRSVILWLIGNLSLAKSGPVYFVLSISVFVSLVLTLFSQKFNVLSMGSENARHLGINVSFVKNTSYILTSLMVGSIVSVSGIIGFVGLIIPHAVRMLFGVDNRIVIPASFFVGAAFLILSDTLARSIIAPSELPVGAITAIIGAPAFIYLLRKKFNSSL